MARFSPVMDALNKFVDSGRTAIGICNGFQILIQAGILGCLVILVFKAVEIRDQLESMNAKVGFGADKIIEKLERIESNTH